MRRDRMDKEIWAINILGTICLIAMVILFPTKSGEASQQPIIKDVEYYEYHPYIHSTEEVCELPKVVVSETAKYILDVTDEERALMERVVMSEASLLPLDGKQAVAQTIVNRVRSSSFPNNIEAVINQPYQYSTSDNGTPDAKCKEAVEAALKYEGFPLDMYYFRTGHYHSFAEDYCQIGNTYFSTERRK